MRMDQRRGEWRVMEGRLNKGGPNDHQAYLGLAQTHLLLIHLPAMERRQAISQDFWIELSKAYDASIHTNFCAWRKTPVCNLHFHKSTKQLHTISTTHKTGVLYQDFTSHFLFDKTNPICRNGRVDLAIWTLLFHIYALSRSLYCQDGKFLPEVLGYGVKLFKVHPFSRFKLIFTTLGLGSFLSNSVVEWCWITHCKKWTLSAFSELDQTVVSLIAHWVLALFFIVLGLGGWALVI